MQVSEQSVFTSDQVSLVTILKLVASKLAVGDLSLAQVRSVLRFLVSR